MWFLKAVLMTKNSKTTVAVKMMKRNSDSNRTKTQISKLKIMIHIEK